MEDLYVEITFVINGVDHTISAPIWMKLEKIRDLALKQIDNVKGILPWEMRNDVGVKMPSDVKVERLFFKPVRLFLMPSIGAGGCV